MIFFDLFLIFFSTLNPSQTLAIPTRAMSATWGCCVQAGALARSPAAPPARHNHSLESAQSWSNKPSHSQKLAYRPNPSSSEPYLDTQSATWGSCMHAGVPAREPRSSTSLGSSNPPADPRSVWAPPPAPLPLSLQSSLPSLPVTCPCAGPCVACVLGPACLRPPLRDWPSCLKVG